MLRPFGETAIGGVRFSTSLEGNLAMVACLGGARESG
jgi:hypothetical protein